MESAGVGIVVKANKNKRFSVRFKRRKQTAIVQPTHSIAVQEENAVSLAVLLDDSVERVHAVQISISLEFNKA